MENFNQVTTSEQTVDQLLLNHDGAQKVSAPFGTITTILENHSTGPDVDKLLPLFAEANFFMQELVITHGNQPSKNITYDMPPSDLLFQWITRSEATQNASLLLLALSTRRNIPLVFYDIITPSSDKPYSLDYIKNRQEKAVNMRNICYSLSLLTTSSNLIKEYKRREDYSRREFLKLITSSALATAAGYLGYRAGMQQLFWETMEIPDLLLSPESAFSGEYSKSEKKLMLENAIGSIIGIQEDSLFLRNLIWVRKWNNLQRHTLFEGKPNNLIASIGARHNGVNFLFENLHYNDPLKIINLVYDTHFMKELIEINGGSENIATSRILKINGDNIWDPEEVKVIDEELRSFLDSYT